MFCEMRRKGCAILALILAGLMLQASIVSNIHIIGGAKTMRLLPFSGLGDIMFNVIPAIIIIGFVFVFGTIIVRSVQGAKQWKRNNESPVLTVDATVVTKRMDVHNYHHNTGTDNMHNMSSSTIYYATFEVTSGDRLEFKVRNTEYGMLVENDMGKLTFQGTRYLRFERN